MLYGRNPTNWRSFEEWPGQFFSTGGRWRNLLRNPRYGPLSEENPELVAEWDFEKNHPLTPDDVSPGSNKKVWWRCGSGSIFCNIVERGSGDPEVPIISLIGT